jgi:hypothetical protein
MGGGGWSQSINSQKWGSYLLSLFHGGSTADPGYSQKYFEIGTSSYPCGELVQTDKCHDSGAKMASPSGANKASPCGANKASPCGANKASPCGANKASPCGASHAQNILRFFSVRITIQREISKPYSFFCCAPTISTVPPWLIKKLSYF